ncbi:MAG: GGDEF domain-containing protein [Candidatus Eremiobacteraeota bacterium]|nr:GGDEF domain-containing protein [Candidatus Eremiobacteraeota bacterium]
MYSVGTRGRRLIALLIGILTLPIVGMTVYFTYNVERRIWFAEDERAGLDRIALLGSFLRDAEDYGSGTACRRPREFVTAARDRADADLSRADRSMTPGTRPERWNEVRAAWLRLRTAATPASNFARLFDPLSWSYGRLSDTSGLTFDPDLEGVDIGDSLTYRLPRSVEEFEGVGRALCAHSATPSLAERLSLQSGIARGEQLTSDAFQDVDDALEHGDTGDAGELRQRYGRSRDALAKAMSSVQIFVIGASPVERHSAEHTIDVLTAALFGLMRSEGPTADRLIEKRLSALGGERLIALIPGVLGLLVALLVVWLVLRLLWERAALQTAERAAAEHERVAMHDSLTGLLNRRAFFAALSNAATSGDPHGVLCILDIDHFKGVNDTYGHLVGDDVLIRIAAIIEAAIRSTDIAARIGGDELAVFLRSPIDRSGVERVLGTITNDAAGRIETRGKVFSTSVSVGAAFVHDVTTASIEDAIGRADAALYSAKASARGSYVISNR